MDFASLPDETPVAVYLDQPGLDVRIRNMILNDNLSNGTFRDLRSLRNLDLMYTPNFGKTSLRKFREAFPDPDAPQQRAVSDERRARREQMERELLAKLKAKYE